MVIKMGKFFAYFLKALVLFVMITALPAQAGQITGLRIGQNSSGARLVFDADSRFDYKVFTLSEPNRLVVDTQNMDVASAVMKNMRENGFVKNIRTGTVGVSGVRIVFDLIRPVAVKKAFMLAPQSNFKWRLAIDMETVNERDFIAKVGSANAHNSSDYNAKNNSSVANSVSSETPKSANTKRVIVIDAGHGGVDPGAIGYSGTYEKNITLSMAKELKELLDKNPRYKVYLTRSRDFFIPLRERVNISRKHNPDLFNRVVGLYSFGGSIG